MRARWSLAAGMLLLAAALPPRAAAQDVRVLEGVRLYQEEGDAREAAALLTTALASGRLHVADSLRALVFLSHAQYALGREVEAESTVRQAVRLHPCIRPSSELAPPPLAAHYRRSQLDRLRCDVTPTTVTLLSAAVPGLGNVVMGQYGSALLHLAAVGGGAYLTHTLDQSARDRYREYQEATSADDAKRLYDSTIRTRRLALAAGVGTALAHVLGVRCAWQAGTLHERRIRPFTHYSGEPLRYEIGVGLQIDTGVR